MWDLDAARHHLRHDFAPLAALPTRGALLVGIERLAGEIGRRAPEVGAEADEIVALVDGLREVGPNRAALVEAIEDVCGDDLSGCCVSRIADAVMKLCGNR